VIDEAEGEGEVVEVGAVAVGFGYVGDGLVVVVDDVGDEGERGGAVVFAGESCGFPAFFAEVEGFAAVFEFESADLQGIEAIAVAVGAGGQ